MKIRLAAAAALWAVAGLSAAVEIETLNVNHQGASYRLRLSARLDAAPTQVFARLAAFEQLPALNPAILSARREGATLLHTESDYCLLGFCRRLHQLQRVQIRPAAGGGVIEASTEASADFRGGHSRWTVTPAETGSRLLFESEIEPGFWLPPYLGPRAVTRQLREQALATVSNLERAARD